jgi:Domain of unknown function (DUF1707)
VPFGVTLEVGGYPAPCSESEVVFVDSSDVAFPSPIPSPGRRTVGPDLRASDAERDVTAAELSVHFQAGRLKQDEFDERLTLAFGARTRGDLERLLTDLPPVPVPPPARPEPEPLPATQGVATGYWLLPLVIPLLLVGVVAVGAASHPGNGAGALFLLWWLIPVMIFRTSRHWGR